MADPTGTLTEPTGTPDPKEPEQAGGAGSGEAGGAGEGTDNWQEKASKLEEQLKQEREKRLSELASLEDERKRRKELEAAQAAPPTGGTPDPVSQAADILNRAAMGEYVDPQLQAQASMVLMRAIVQHQETIRTEDQISRLPEDESTAVRAYMQKGYPLNAAKDAAERDRLKAQAERLTKADEERRARDEAERKRAEDDVVSVAPKPVPAADLRARSMTTDEYIAKLDSLPRDEAIKLKARRDAGLLRLKD